MEHVARTLNKDPVAVKTLNLYKQGQVKHFIMKGTFRYVRPWKTLISLNILRPLILIRFFTVHPKETGVIGYQKGREVSEQTEQTYEKH